MSKTRTEPWGYIVVETANEFEQVLALDISAGMPEGGILTWAAGRVNRCFFPTKDTARAAIQRTEHYRRAFGRTDLPEKANCRIHLIAAVHAAKP